MRLSDLQFSTPVGLISRVSGASASVVEYNQRAFIISPGYGQTVVELLFVLVVVDAFVQLVAGCMVSMTLFCVPSWRRTL